MTLAAKRRLFWLSYLLSVAALYYVVTRAIDWALVTLAGTWP